MFLPDGAVFLEYDDFRRSKAQASAVASLWRDKWLAQPKVPVMVFNALAIEAFAVVDGF